MKLDRTVLITGILLPAILLGAYIFWHISLIANGQLPDPMAMHWGFSGKADGFASPLANLLLSCSLVVLLWGIFGWASTSKRVPIYMRRIFSFGLLFLVAWIIGLFALLTASQIGLSDASDAQLPLPWLLSGLVVALALVGLFAAKPVIKITNQLEVTTLGIPLIKISLDEIAKTSVTTLRARDFGGWGIRFNGKAVAVIPTSGPGIEILAKQGERILIRHDQPELAVQLLGKAN